MLRSGSLSFFLPSKLSAARPLLTSLLFVVASLVLVLNILQKRSRWYAPPAAVDPSAAREEVKEAFITSWHAYTRHAWGKDRFHPISEMGSQMSPKGLGWIIVDSLDTMMIMNLTSQLSDAREWVSESLTYDQNQDVNTFETTIRMLGGLLSAHYLAGKLDASSPHDDVYLNKAIDLADRLLGAYNSGSGIPYASVNLKTATGIPSHADGGSSSTAEASTLQMEMKYISELTGDEKYWRKAEAVMKVLDDNEMEDGLLPIFVHPESGKFTSKEIRLGSRGDSYYEYLIKQYLQTHEPIYLQMWTQALHGIRKHLLASTAHSHLQFPAELPAGIGSRLLPKMDHLVCFLPGAIALGATNGLSLTEARRLPSWNENKEQEMRLAREVMKTCWGMYAVTRTGLAPEIAYFAVEDAMLDPRWTAPSFPASSSDAESDWRTDYIIKPLDAHNLQRPETVESLFLMYRITGDAVYREWGWRIFRAFKQHTGVGVGGGYTSLGDVEAVPPPRRDNMEGFWMAETLKYLYLLFSPAEVLPLSEVVFNTEAHVFPRIKEPKFGTGWERKERRR